MIYDTAIVKDTKILNPKSVLLPLVSPCKLFFKNILFIYILYLRLRAEGEGEEEKRILSLSLLLLWGRGAQFQDPDIMIQAKTKNLITEPPKRPSPL